MGVLRKSIYFVVACSLFKASTFSFAPAQLEPNRILFLLQTNRLSEAIANYREYAHQQNQHDLALVQRIALRILEEGAASDDVESQLLTLFGAGISLNETASPILERGICSQNPQFQLISLNALSRLQDNNVDSFMRIALRSNFLIVRLEALHQLARKKSPEAFGQAEALMCKIPDELLFVFPQFFAAIGSPAAIKELRRFLIHSNENVRIAAILSILEYGRDDLLPVIRTMLNHRSLNQQETCCYAIGMMKDQKSIDLLEKLADNDRAPFIQLAALQALYQMGKEESRLKIESMARAGSLFAITLLGSMPGSEKLLMELSTSSSLQVKINAALALLERRDSQSLIPLIDFFISDTRDLSFDILSSPGKSLHAYKVIPSSKQNFEKGYGDPEKSLRLREDALLKCTALPEKDFLQLANLLFQVQQNDLMPVLIESLEALHTPATIALLKKYQQCAGAPLIRQYCNLALYHLREEGPYAELLKDWVLEKQQEDLIRFRPFIEDFAEEEVERYQLTPKATSRLLVEAFEAFAVNQGDAGIDLLLHAIQHGNLKNKYALAGLLVRASE